MDPVILSAAAISLLVWAVGGGAVYTILIDQCPAGFQTLWFTAVCGPAAIALGLWRGWQAVRQAVLKRFGVERYTCCGGHREPPAGGQSNTGHGCKRHGYPADSAINHP